MAPRRCGTPTSRPDQVGPFTPQCGRCPCPPSRWRGSGTATAPTCCSSTALAATSPPSRVRASEAHVLHARGLVGDDGWLTALARRSRKRVEARTDQLPAPAHAGRPLGPRRRRLDAQKRRATRSKLELGTDDTMGASNRRLLTKPPLSMSPGADLAAPGAAVTVALCGHWKHEPPCPLAAHHTSTTRSAMRYACAPCSPLTRRRERRAPSHRQRPLHRPTAWTSRCLELVATAPQSGRAAPRGGGRPRQALDPKLTQQIAAPSHGRRACCDP